MVTKIREGRTDGARRLMIIIDEALEFRGK
jgi:hypothetical protein